jgi:predicted secreted hydrolase
MNRRHFLLNTLIGTTAYADVYCSQSYAAGASIPVTSIITPPVLQPFPKLQFPRDHGAHNDFRTEWWYMTGHLQSDKSAGPFGFQVTFFRSRIDAAHNNASAFAAKQLLFAHAALSDVKAGVLHHDQRIMRAGFGIAAASDKDTDVQIRDWTLSRSRRNEIGYKTQVKAKDFTLDLIANPTQPLLLQGQGGYSRKGPEPKQASYYYSQPQLTVRGSVTHAGITHSVQGTAWLDHEWSESILHPEAVGWDWIGMNLLDGGALTAFRLRKRDGSALWSGGSYRAANGATQVFAENQVRFEPLDYWTSPSTKARYPVKWKVHTPAGIYLLASVFRTQELDNLQSTGTVYWEGLSELRNEKGALVGRGYLEMTGYAEPLKL